MITLMEKTIGGGVHIEVAPGRTVLNVEKWWGERGGKSRYGAIKINEFKYTPRDDSVKKRNIRVPRPGGGSKIGPRFSRMLSARKWAENST